MEKIAIIIALLLLTACLPQTKQELIIKNINMKITSSAFSNNGNIPVKYSCDGEKISPDLQIADVPAKAQSLALILDDPDAVIGTFNHWLVWNIDPSTKQIAANSVPAGAVQGTTSGGRPGYYPPCPNKGTHRYIFKLYALDVKLDLSANSDKIAVEKTMQGHILDSAELTGLYGRK